MILVIMCVILDMLIVSRDFYDYQNQTPGDYSDESVIICDTLWHDSSKSIAPWLKLKNLALTNH